MLKRDIGKATAFGGFLGLGTVLLQHGDEIDLPRGTYVEMILQSSLSLDPGLVERNASYVAPPEVANNGPVPEKDRRRRVYPQPAVLPASPILIPGLPH